VRPREGLGRFLDVVISLALLLLSFPFLPLIFLLIRFDDRGPAIYRQMRVGKHGRHFVLFKFRSMVVDAERASGPSWAHPGDPRITRVGKLLRLIRVDELPQLVNVLRGDMSLVGPRPERPHFTDQLMTAISGYGERNVVKPGITGWAQINYPYGASVHDSRVKLSYDLYYLENRSALFDIRILFATVPVVLFGRGAR
jgi:lipopolysaccharide/colanic/teichoic acid biosynthesis glycosyltransferase